MNMDFLAIPADVLASVLNRTDPLSVCNLLSTSRAVCEGVRSFRDLIHFDELDRFVDALPTDLGSPNLSTECNVHLFASSSASSMEHTMNGTGRLILGCNRAQYISIVCPTAIERVRVILGGCLALFFDRRLLQLFATDEFDIMAFLRHLPAVELQSIWIEYETRPNTPATLSVAVGPPGPQIGSFVCLVTWRFIEVFEIASGFCNRAAECSLKMFPNGGSLGFVVAIGIERPSAAEVKSFTMVIDGAEHVVSGSSTVSSSIPRHLQNFPVNLHNCHYIPTSERMVVDDLILQVNFWEPFAGEVVVWQVRTNHLFTNGTVYGLMLAS